MIRTLVRHTSGNVYSVCFTVYHILLTIAQKSFSSLYVCLVTQLQLDDAQNVPTLECHRIYQWSARLTPWNAIQSLPRRRFRRSYSTRRWNLTVYLTNSSVCLVDSQWQNRLFLPFVRLCVGLLGLWCWAFLFISLSRQNLNFRQLIKPLHVAQIFQFNCRIYNPLDML